jgi:hypothetical protein
MCGDIVYSRIIHEMRWCTCGNLAVDGGPHPVNEKNPSYSRIMFSTKLYKSVKINIKGLVKKNYHAVLQNDCYTHKDEYGLVHDPKYTEEMVEIAKVKLALLTIK